MSQIPIKRPIPLAPAPARFGTPRLRAVEPDAEPSESSSEEEIELVARTPGLYAELEGGTDDELEELAPEEEEQQQGDRDEIIRARVAAAQEQMKGILESLTPEQQQRYETFRRVGFPRPMVKKIMQRVLEGYGGGKDKTAAANINPSAVIVAAGIAKVFVGELVEEARLIMEEWNDDTSNPLMPSHVMEAFRRLKRRGLVPSSSNYKKKSLL